MNGKRKRPGNKRSSYRCLSSSDLRSVRKNFDMRYIVSKEALNQNIALAQSLIGLRKLSLIFKEYYEHLFPLVSQHPTGDIFAINLQGSICYALGMANEKNKGALVNNIMDAKSLHDKGINRLYIPIDTYDGREGLPVYEAKLLAEAIHEFFGKKTTATGLVTNGCINDFHLQTKDEWVTLWSVLGNHLTGLSVGGSYWLDKAKDLPEFVKDVRIGRFMLFGYIPYSDKKYGRNCMVAECNVIGVNLTQHKVMVDLGDAYCDPAQCVPCNKDMVFVESSSNYALYFTPQASRYYIGQRLLFIPNYKHSSALARLKVRYDYE